MSDFARDLGHLLARRPIEARRHGPLLRARRWFQRNPAAGTALVVGPGLLVVAGLATLLREKSHARVLGDRLLETQRARDESDRQRANVLRLSAFQALANLEREADELWPCTPERLPAMQAWLERAEALVGEIPGHLATLEEIRSRARPRTPEQLVADRRSNPSLAEWETSRAELRWLRRMSKEEPWPDESAVEAELARETLPSDAGSLAAMAWQLVDPTRGKAVFGSEVRGLLLARRALAAADDTHRASARNVLAYALFRTGRFVESLAEGATVHRRARRVAAGRAPIHPRRDPAGRGVVGPESPRSKRAEFRRRAEELAGRIEFLERDLAEHRTWEFEVEEDSWWHAELSKLVSDLEGFRDEERGGLFSSGTSEAHGWGIPKRAAVTRSIAERSVDGPEARRRWEKAVAAIAGSPKYGGLSIAPSSG
jgi:hypothetical protein